MAEKRKRQRLLELNRLCIYICIVMCLELKWHINDENAFLQKPVITPEGDGFPQRKNNVIIETIQ